MMVLCVLAVYGQRLPASITDRLDSLFRKWDRTSSPGWAVGVVRNDSLIFARGYGMANLEYGVPISPETIFHMASVSKQFTAFSIVLLARQGKLNLDDDIHKYLSWFPDVKEKITIRNLLTHTSGIRDQWQLLSIAGTRIDDVITQDQIIKILSRQQRLNFKPGAEYLYCNSGFTMLAEVVKSITGQTLRQFTDSAIFRPLGMAHTHFHDDYTEVVPNRSYSYNEEDNGQFSNAVLSYSNVGATSLFTNVEDMSKWVMNFYDHKVGDGKDIDQLTQQGVLTSGRRLDYALGIAVDSFRGRRRFQHGGADAGYRTFVSVFPELKMGVVVLCNLANVNSQAKADQVAALFIPEAGGQEKKATKRVYTDSAVAILSDPGKWAPFEGAYTSEDGAMFRFALADRKLWWINPTGRYLLVGKGKDTAELFSDPTVWFTFSSGGAGQTISEEYWPENHRHLWKYDTTALADKDLVTYAGSYYCPELDCRYTISLKDHHLRIGSAKYNEEQVTVIGDNLRVDWWWMSNLKIIRDAHGKITGFEVNDGRVRHLWFKKEES
jgi:CubicO group peptidase (beta-lactamase class C family)